MHNEFTAVIERDGEWYVAFCPEIRGPTGRGTRKMKRGAALLTPSRSFSKTVARKASVVYRRTPNGRR